MFFLQFWYQVLKLDFLRTFLQKGPLFGHRHMVSDINNKEKVKQVGGKINELIYSKPIP